MPPKSQRRNQVSIDIEPLESRQLLAAFGTPWPEPRDLSISFPADGVAVGNYTNDLRETLDQIADRQAWEELVLRAYQTWSIHADINVGLRNDHDIDFGTPGFSTGDPRFGELRIGAMPQTGLLASALPFQSLAGTYSGDILLNSNEQFVYHDWENQVGPDPLTLGEFDRDLFSVVLHESGNTLGLDDNLIGSSVMFRQYIAPKGILSQDDISAIQALYGARSDPYEQVNNGQLQVATQIPTPVGFDPDAEIIRTRASLATGTDVDYFQLTPLPGQGNVTIRLRAEGISLLQSRLEILDQNGLVIKEASSESVFENDNTLTINGLGSHSVVYLRVSALDPSDVYSVGDYELEVDYRKPSARSADPVRSSYDSGADSLFANFALADSEQGVNDTLGDAQWLTPVPYFTETRYELESSVSSANDVDVWEITAPETITGRLLISVAGVGAEQPDLNVQVVDSEGYSVGAAGRIHADGTFLFEVAQPEADHDYYLRVSVDPSSAVSVGNYVVTAEFTSPNSEMNDLVSGDLSSSVDDFASWTANKSKLYRFDLTATGGELGELVKLTIYDAHTQQMRLVLAAVSGVTRTAYVWLPEGDYILRFTAYSRNGDPVDSIGYSLTVDGISDDIEVDPEDVDWEEEYYTYQEEPLPYYEEYEPPSYEYEGEPYYYYYYY
jgi:hypothetical protein